MKFKNVEDFSSHYTLHKQLGRGSFGTVHAGLHVRSQMPCAIKIIAKARIRSARDREQNKNEFEILEEISHPHIVRVFELMEDQSNYYVVMELMQGGDL